MGNGEGLPRKFSLSRECGELGIAAEVAMQCSAVRSRLNCIKNLRPAAAQAHA